MDEVINMRPQSLLKRILFPQSSCHLGLLALVAIALFAVQITSAFAQAPKPQAQTPQRASDKGSDVARGKYLVEGVAMCGQCHTPLDSRGNPDRRHWLQGGPVPFMPSETNADWPVRVPRIGGTPPADDADMVKLLTTGIWTTRARLRFPMPQFRMDRNDAEAVVAYLKTLPSQP
jgi:mono/diheme cytochrome c family protein